MTTGPVEWLGTGGSYTAWRVSSGKQARVLRPPRCPPHGLLRSMQAEFEVLRRVPPKLGASAVVLKLGSDGPLGTPCMVTTHILGRALRTADWSRRLATALAYQIAYLHEALTTATATAPSTAFVPSADEQGEELVTWWGERHPQTLTDPRIRSFLPAWRHGLDRLAPAFEVVPIHPVVHDDVVAPNVILGPGGLPRFIDFEWSGPSDTAKDLALTGGQVTGGPQYLPMTSDDVATLVTECPRYSWRSRLTQGTGAADPRRLLERRGAYELLDRLGNLLYCLSRPGESRYGRWVDELAHSLTARLGG